MRKITSTICLLLVFITGFSQDEKQYSFIHYTVNNGLAAYNISNIAQDEQGYLWIGTINGLQRFDGTRFKTFRHNPSNPKSIPDNFIIQLMFDKQQNLWLLFANGDIGIFDTHGFTFRKVKVKLKDEVNLKRSRYLLQDSDGNIFYIFRFTEVTTYNKQSNEFSSVYNTFTIPENWRVTNMIDDPVRKKYWLFCDSGLAVFNKQTRNISYRNHNIEKEPIIEQFSSLTGTNGYLLDSKNRLWFMNWPNGNPCLIYCFDLQKEVPVLNQFNISPIVKKYNEPALMRECKDGSLWIYGLNVLASFDEQSKTFTQIQSDDSNGKGIYYESANLFEDRNGSIWVCTSNNGLYVFNPSKQLLKSVSHTDRIKLTKGEGAVMSFMTTSNNDLLVGCWGDGLYRYDKHLKPVNLNIQGIEEVNGLTVWGMCRLKTEPVICMIGQPGFIITYNEITGETKRFEPAVFNSVTIRQVLQDKFGNMWYGTHHGGLFKGNALPGIKQMDTGITRFDGIPKTQIRNLIEDHDGNIWVATELYGVYKIDPGSGKILIHLTEKGDKGHNILSNAVSCLLEYNDSLMIIGGGGVNIYNTHSGLVSQVSAVDGLPSDMVVSMEKDNEGFIWIGTMTGLCRMNMQKKTFSYYDRNDGIANDQFDVSASYRLADGRLLFGTSSDFVVFNPSEAAVAINIHPPVITDFSVLNNSLSVDSLLKAGRVDLPADHNSITIGFSNLDYLPGNKLMYFYMMEGIDKEWKKSNELNLAVYNYLPPGTYTFKVKAEYVDFTGNSPVSSIIIKIHPPFWKTWWFISLTIVLFSVLLYWIDRLQLKKKESLLKIRSEIADNLHREIHTALNNINILSEMAKIKADTEPAKSKEYIEQIHTRSHNMINSMDDMLWSLHPGNDSMVKTIWRIREFIDELKSRFTAQIELAVEEKVELLELNMKFRHGALILFKEGIKNLLQAGTKKVSIHIGYEKNKLTFTMQFDNSNCDMQALNNLLHRQDLEKHMQSIHAAMEVQVHKTNSVIVLNIPVTGN